MPFVIAKVNVPVSKEQESKIKTRIGKAIENVPGKNENYLLFGLEDGYHFYLRGDGSQKIAYIQADIFGNEDHIGFDRFGAEMTVIFHHVLGIPPENIYIKFDDMIQGSTACSHDKLAWRWGQGLVTRSHMSKKWGESRTGLRMWVGLWECEARNNP